MRRGRNYQKPKKILHEVQKKNAASNFWYKTFLFSVHCIHIHRRFAAKKREIIFFFYINLPRVNVECVGSAICFKHIIAFRIGILMPFFSVIVCYFFFFFIFKTQSHSRSWDCDCDWDVDWDSYNPLKHFNLIIHFKTVAWKQKHKPHRFRNYYCCLFASWLSAFPGNPPQWKQKPKCMAVRVITHMNDSMDVVNLF